MALILDIVLAGIFIVLVVSAAKKGFVLTILEVVAIIAALFCASYFSKPIAQGSYDMFLKGNIEKKINSEISEHQVPQNLGDVAFDSIPEYAVTFAECAGINVSKIKTNINNTINSYVANGQVDSIGQKIAETCIEPIAVAGIGIIMYFVMFTVFLLLFRLVAKGVSKAIQIPLVGTADKLLGAAIGALRGAAVLVVISTVFVTMLAKGDSEFAVAIRESKVIGFVNNFNPFIDKLQELFK